MTDKSRYFMFPTSCSPYSSASPASSADEMSFNSKSDHSLLADSADDHSAPEDIHRPNQPVHIITQLHQNIPDEQHSSKPSHVIHLPSLSKVLQHDGYMQKRKRPLIDETVVQPARDRKYKPLSVTDIAEEPEEYSEDEFIANAGDLDDYEEDDEEEDEDEEEEDEHYGDDRSITHASSSSKSSIKKIKRASRPVKQSKNSLLSLAKSQPVINAPITSSAKTITANSKNISCPRCGRSFSSRRNLKRHLRTMESKYFGICRSGKGRVTNEEELEIIAVHALQMMSNGAWESS